MEKKDELKLAERYTASPDFGRFVQSQVIPVPNNKIRRKWEPFCNENEMVDEAIKHSTSGHGTRDPWDNQSINPTQPGTGSNMPWAQGPAG